MDRVACLRRRKGLNLVLVSFVSSRLCDSDGLAEYGEKRVQMGKMKIKPEFRSTIKLSSERHNEEFDDFYFFDIFSLDFSYLQLLENLLEGQEHLLTDLILLQP